MTRKAIINLIVQRIEPNTFDALYGIKQGHSSDLRYRNVFFGICGRLDAEIRVYGPRFMVLKWTCCIPGIPIDGWIRFKSLDELMDYISTTFISK